MGRQRFAHFPRFKNVKYERPHSKTLEVPALAETKGQMALHFKALKYYEILNNRAPKRRQNRFRMELHPFHLMSSVSQPHDLPFLCPGAYFKTFRQRLSFYNKRVVTGCLKGIGQAAINGLPVMKDGGGLAMPDPFGPDHIAPKGIANGLMPQADAHDGNDLIKLPDHFNRNARLLR